MFRDNLWLFCLLTHGSKKCYNGMLPGILPGHSRARAVQNPHAIGEGFRERRCEKRSCWSTEGELNSRPTQYQCVVLPTELSVHLEGWGSTPLITFTLYHICFYLSIVFLKKVCGFVGKGSVDRPRPLFISTVGYPLHTSVLG